MNKEVFILLQDLRKNAYGMQSEQSSLLKLTIYHDYIARSLKFSFSAAVSFGVILFITFLTVRGGIPFLKIAEIVSVNTLELFLMCWSFSFTGFSVFGLVSDTMKVICRKELSKHLNTLAKKSLVSFIGLVLSVVVFIHFIIPLATQLIPNGDGGVAQAVKEKQSQIAGTRSSYGTNAISGINSDAEKGKIDELLTKLSDENLTVGEVESNPSRIRFR